MTHLLRLADHDADRIRWLLGVAAEAAEGPERFAGALSGRVIGLLARVQGRRTRLTFGAAAGRLGAQPLFVPARDLGVDPEEEPEEAGRVLGSAVDQVVAGLSRPGGLARLAATAGVPVINGGGADGEPCRALGDLLTLRSRLLDLAGRKLAWVGRPQPLLFSLLVAAPALGIDLDLVPDPGSALDAAGGPPEGAPTAGSLHAAALAEGRRRADAAGTLIGEQEEAAAMASSDAVYRDGRLAWREAPESTSFVDVPDRNRVSVAMAVLLWLADAV